MNKDYIADIYKDFFGEELTLPQEKEIQDDVSLDISNLLLSDASLDVLQKIILYMKQFSTKEKNMYLNFHLILQSNNREFLERIESFFKTIAFQYSYVSIHQFAKISFYDVDSFDTLKKVFESNGIIAFKDLKALEAKDVDFQKKFFHLLKDSVILKKVIILEGSKDEVGTFFEHDSSLQKSSFPFVLEEKILGVSDVYQDVLDRVNQDGNLSDKLSLQILDYITNTYDKSDMDYPTYRDLLCREVLLNHSVPAVEKSKSIDEVFERLNELVGLSKVKKTLYELVDYMNLREKGKDLSLNNVNLHMVFLGNPGTGKTTVARLIADILYELKYIKQNKLIEVGVKDLVAEYVGQTAPKVMSVVERAMGGILFIDEAYALASKNGDSYHDEAIATLIKAMEDYRDQFVVIFAGYTKEMQDFLDSNSGIVSRIGYTFEFDDYTEDELVEIFNGMIKKSGFVVEEEAINKLRDIIRRNKDMKNFGNARFVRNIFEKSIIKHATRVKKYKSQKIIHTITVDDISIENLNIH